MRLQCKQNPRPDLSVNTKGLLIGLWALLCALITLFVLDLCIGFVSYGLMFGGMVSVIGGVAAFAVFAYFQWWRAFPWGKRVIRAGSPRARAGLAAASLLAAAVAVGLFEADSLLHSAKQAELTLAAPPQEKTPPARERAAEPDRAKSPFSERPDTAVARPQKP